MVETRRLFITPEPITLPAGPEAGTTQGSGESNHERPDKAAAAARNTIGARGSTRRRRGRKRGARNPLGRYPWKSAVRQFVRQQLGDGAWSDATAFERQRLLLRIERDLHRLGLTTNPRRMTTDDVRAYLVWLRDRSGRNAATQCKAVLLLADFLEKAVGNLSGKRLRRQFPKEPPSGRPRPPFKELVLGFDRLSTVEDPWQRAVLRGQIALYVGTLVRPSEGRLASRGDLDERLWALRVRHPKGKTQERTAHFLEERCRKEMAYYLIERATRLRESGYNPEDPTLPLFPSFGPQGDELRHYTAQAFNRMWRKVHPKGLDHYCARRGMAQEAVDRDPRLLGAVSQQLGHVNISTTVRYYAQPRPERIRVELEKVWEEHEEGSGGIWKHESPTMKPQFPDPAYR